MNRISFVYLTATFTFVACLITSNVFMMKKQLPEEPRRGRSDLSTHEGSPTKTPTSRPTSPSDSQSESETKSLFGRAKDFISRKKSDGSTAASSASGKPGWVPPAADRERISRETQAELENTAATARSRREKIEARIQELKSQSESLSDEQQQAALKKISKKESDAATLAEKEKSIRDRIDRANEPVKISRADGKTIEIQRDVWEGMTARERKDATYRSLEKGSEERKAGKEAYMASLTTKEQREHKEHSDDKKAIAAGKIGALGTIGTLGAGALISAGVATVKALTDDDDKKLTSGQAQVQIFEGGTQPTGSSVEGDTFQPTGGDTIPGIATPTDAPAGDSFTAVGPID